MSIVTAANYNVYRGTSDTSQDTQIAALITMIESYVQTVLGMSFSTTTLTERYSVRVGQQTIQLRTYPVQSVTSIKCFYGSGASDYNTLDTDEYYTNLTTGVVSVIGAGQRSMLGSDAWDGYTNGGITTAIIGQVPCFTPGIDNHEIVYVGGNATVPDGLKMCIYQAIDALLNTAGDNPEMKSESVLDYSYTKNDKSMNTPFAKTMQLIFCAYANGATLL